MKNYLLLLLIPLMLSCKDYSYVEFELPAEVKTSELEYYPSNIDEYEYENKQYYTVYVWQDEMVHYIETFDQFGYYGNGVAWEELCRTMIELENPELLDKITTESEAGQATIYAVNKDVQIEVAKAIHKWSTDKEKLRTAFSNVTSIYMY